VGRGGDGLGGGVGWAEESRQMEWEGEGWGPWARLPPAAHAALRSSGKSSAAACAGTSALSPCLPLAPEHSPCAGAHACSCALDTSWCEGCAPGFMLTTEENSNGSGDVTTCTPCALENCASCSLTEAGQQACDACKSGFALTDDLQACVPCPVVAGCQLCYVEPDGGKPVCGYCQDGYSMQDGACLPCTPHCAACDFSGGQETCHSCWPGYILASNGSACVEDVAHCNGEVSVAGSPFQCMQCADGYRRGPGGHACTVPCADQHCKSCRLLYGREFCFECTPGFIPDDSLEHCLPTAGPGPGPAPTPASATRQLGRRVGEWPGRSMRSTVR